MLLIGGLVFALGLTVATSTGARTAPPTAPTHADVEFITDFSDARRLVGATDNVFVGRVIAQVGTKRVVDDLPETQFQVEVLETIKGALTGRVTVNQQGGYEGRELILVEDDPLLVPGQEYLFATGLHPGEGWHTLVPGYGDLLITDDQQRADLIAKFREAAREEIVYTPD
jgi:hypothetical protein